MRRFLLLLLVAAGGCDRATIDPIGPDLLVSTPDLSVVQVDPDLRLTLRPPGLTDGPVFLQLNGEDVPFDSTVNGFVYLTTLDEGLNTFLLDIADDAGTVERDTLYALHLMPQNIPIVGSIDGVARADAAGAMIADGRLLVTGGTGINGTPLASATFLTPAGSQIRTEDTALLSARTGHTATPINGGLLLLGGTGRDGAFVGDGEWIRPDGSSIRVNADGDIARTGHTAFRIRLNGVTYIYLMNGFVPAGSGTAASGTIDVFEVEGEGPDAIARLVRLSPPGGAGAFAPIADHVQVRTGQASATLFGIAPDGEATASQFVWTTPGTTSYPFSLRVRPTATSMVPRVGAASAEVEDGLALILGGRTDEGTTLGSIEVYAPTANRTFRFPPSIQLLVPRSDHVATILTNGRILVSGGRSSDGVILSSLESFQL